MPPGQESSKDATVANFRKHQLYAKVKYHAKTEGYFQKQYIVGA